MKFSIIVPTYNRAHIIEKTLDSILNQSYSNFEVIIVDNCSTDNPYEILKSYLKDSRFSYIVHDKNYERSKSRNTGMINATGDYLTFLDSDDIMLNDCLQDAYNFVIKNKHFKIFHNKFNFATVEGQIINRYQQSVNYDCAFNSILSGNFLACIGVFIDKEIYTKFRFTEQRELIGVEDWQFWIKILNNYNDLGHIDKVNSLIIEHSERTVNNTESEMFDKKITLFKQSILTDLNLKKSEKKCLDFSCDFIVAVSYCDAKKKSKASHFLIKILKQNPFHFFSPKILNLIKNILFR
ncbi:MAG: glycosyltransferase family 2 protein [Flavobacteriia bacterium]|nr:glycosyltransferase family 2 protein [Flavobacteriia bacterium]